MMKNSATSKLDFWKMSNLDITQKLSLIQPSNWWEMDWYQDKDCQQDCKKKNPQNKPKGNGLAIY